MKYEEIFKAIATMCERNQRESAYQLFLALVKTIEEEAISDYQRNVQI